MDLLCKKSKSICIWILGTSQSYCPQNVLHQLRTTLRCPSRFLKHALKLEQKSRNCIFILFIKVIFLLCTSFFIHIKWYSPILSYKMLFILLMRFDIKFRYILSWLESLSIVNIFLKFILSIRPRKSKTHKPKSFYCISNRL